MWYQLHERSYPHRLASAIATYAPQRLGFQPAWLQLRHCWGRHLRQDPPSERRINLCVAGRWQDCFAAILQHRKTTCERLDENSSHSLAECVGPAYSIATPEVVLLFQIAAFPFWCRKSNVGHFCQGWVGSCWRAGERTVTHRIYCQNFIISVFLQCCRCMRPYILYI